MENTGKKWEGSTGEVTIDGDQIYIDNVHLGSMWCKNSDSELPHNLNLVATIQKSGLMPSELIDKVEKLQAFKDYVHDRLDKMGIEKDPESIHKEAGCRIGGRLDILQQQMNELLVFLNFVNDNWDDFLKHTNLAKSYHTGDNFKFMNELPMKVKELIQKIKGHE